MEIKKAFEQMKKDIKKELGYEGGFTMSARQIQNRTATYGICNVIPFEDEIAREKADDARVQDYDSWTAEEKARSHERSLEHIARVEERFAKYGTKRNEAEQRMSEIMNSKAFARFQAEVGKVECTLELLDKFIYIMRFHY